jgi:hypothetical protein
MSGGLIVDRRVEQATCRFGGDDRATAEVPDVPGGGGRVRVADTAGNVGEVETVLGVERGGGCRAAGMRAKPVGSMPARWAAALTALATV